MRGLGQDLHLAARLLARHRLSTLLVAGSLALAVGGNTTVFSVVDGLLLRPWPYADPASLVLVWQHRHDRPDLLGPLSATDAELLRQRTTAFSDLAAVRTLAVTLTGGDQPEEAPAVVASPTIFHLLGVDPAIGRGFLPEEGQPGGERVVVLGHDLWQRRFGGAAGAVGRTLGVDGQRYTVVGVLPKGFDFLLGSADLWLPLALPARSPARFERNLLLLGRLAPGVSLDRARGETAALADRLAAERPDLYRDLGTRVVALREQIPGPTDRKLLALLQGAMVFVLLIACANIANLLLARGQARQREMAVRAALGAGRGSIVRQLLAESLTLAALGGAAGLALGWWWTRAIAASLAGSVPRLGLPAMDARVVAFCVGLSAVAGVLSGLAPALHASRTDLAAALQESAQTTRAPRRRRLIHALVVAEVTLALVLLCGTGLLVAGMVSLETLDPGFDAQGLLTFHLTLPASRYPDGARATSLWGELQERLEALPEVRAASAANSLPRGRGTPTAPARAADGPTAGAESPPVVQWLAASPGYFRALGIPLLAGRPLSPADRPEGRLVTVVSRRAAHLFWPGEDPVGHRLTLLGAPREVVGVVGDVVQGRMMSQDGPRPLVYLPLAQQPQKEMSFLLRTLSDPHLAARSTREAVRALDPDLPVAHLMTLDEHIEAELVGPRIVAALVGGFGALALLLAALGLYGVIAFSVTQRTQEIGVRMALGARRGDVLRLVARQGLALTALGVALGAPGVWWVSRTVAGFLAGFTSVAWAAVPGVAALLVLVAAAATVLPARGAASLDPLRALRRE